MKPSLNVVASWTDKTASWVRAGLLTAEQAEAIVAFESGPVGVDAEVTASYQGELTPVAEGLAYLAMIFTVASGASLALRSFRTDLPRILALGLAALVGIALGQRLIRMGGRSWGRIGGVLSAFGTLCATGLMAFVLVRHADVANATTALLAGSFLTLLSWALWRNRDRFFQLATTIGGFYVTLLASIEEFKLHLQPWAIALIFWVTALVIVAVHRWLRPSYGALFLAMAVALVAGPAVGARSQLLGIALGLLTAGLGIALALPRRNIAVLIISAIATFVNLIRFFALYVHSSAALVVVFLGSATVIVVLVVRFIQGHTVIAPPVAVSTETSATSAPVEELPHSN